MGTEAPIDMLAARIRELYATELGMLNPVERQQRLVRVNWQVGRYIVETEQDGAARARYGTKLIDNLAKALLPDADFGLSKRNLQYSRAFYNAYEIVQTSAQLTWSHYVALLSIKNKDLRDKIEQRTISENLPIDGLRQLIAVTLKETQLTNSKRTVLTPREGTPGICKVVRVATPDGAVRMLDLGFHVVCGVSSQRIRKFVAGDYVTWFRDAAKERLQKVRCGRGERYCYFGYVQKVVDGDTLVVSVQLANGTSILTRLRLRGVLAEEAGTARGDECTRYVKRRLPLGTLLEIRTYGQDRFGRYVADVFFKETFLNQLLIDKGLG